MTTGLIAPASQRNCPLVRLRRREAQQRVLGGLTHLDQPSGERTQRRLAQAHGEFGHITLCLGPGKLNRMPALLTPPEAEVDSAQIERTVVGDLSPRPGSSPTESISSGRLGVTKRFSNTGYLGCACRTRR